MDTGARWEQRALEHLTDHGLCLIARNFTSRFGEIDLILTDQNTLVFVEVRFRKRSRHGTAAESVTLKKQKKLIKAAQYFLIRNPALRNAMMRFDVIAIDENDETNYQWIRNAFSL